MTTLNALIRPSCSSVVPAREMTSPVRTRLLGRSARAARIASGWERASEEAERDRGWRKMCVSVGGQSSGADDDDDDGGGRKKSDMGERAGGPKLERRMLDLGNEWWRSVDTTGGRVT